ncbi:hypothetical protein WI36_03580 [Burkholderia ubonensis]|uniref:fatty acid desaturase family protein n=1 Tax=Burkholderia ubonensis TaxID=101571 RepID=UPI0007590A75|nr:fatty acid desaturase family protein [Burkholderia ubonensis]KUZ82567.1 hypothetical protein WI36_03580 [Burkholderia ubonensis]
MPAYRKHRFVASIREQVRPLYQSNNWRGGVAVLGDYAVIALAAAGGARWPWLAPAAIFVIGSRQRALVTLLHDGVHLSLARARWLNRFLTRWPAGFAVFQSDEYYRAIHVPAHHGHLGDPQRDPDYVGFRESGLLAVTSSRAFLSGFFFKTLLLGNALGNVRELVAGRIAYMAGKRGDLARLAAAQAVVAAALSWLAGPLGYLWFWLVPFLTVSHVLAWFLEITEHYRLFGEDRSELEITRNRFPCWWERCFFGMHGETWHLTHHLFPGVPFWNLRRVHEILLQDDAYRAANAARGGLLSAPAGRVSILREILDDIDRTHWRPL